MDYEVQEKLNVSNMSTSGGNAQTDYCFGFRALNCRRSCGNLAHCGNSGLSSHTCQC